MVLRLCTWPHTAKNGTHKLYFYFILKCTLFVSIKKHLFKSNVHSTSSYTNFDLASISMIVRFTLRLIIKFWQQMFDSSPLSELSCVLTAPFFSHRNATPKLLRPNVFSVWIIVVCVVFPVGVINLFLRGDADNLIKQETHLNEHIIKRR